MRTARFTFAVITVALSLVSPLAMPQASAESAALCSLDIQLRLRPGLRLVMNTSGSIASETPGSLVCNGVVGGSPVTGPGTFQVAGTFAGNCAAGTSSGAAAYSIPTVDGLKEGQVHYDVTWAGIVGLITVSDPIYGNGTGPFDFIPVHGNCVTQRLDVIRWSSLQITLEINPAPPPPPQ